MFYKRVADTKIRNRMDSVMSETISIKADNLGKVYKLFTSPFDRVKETFDPLRRKYHQRFQALSDISFEINKGDTVGVNRPKR